MFHYKTIHHAAIIEYKEKSSKFLAHAYEIKNAEEVKEIIQALAKSHPKAVHVCYAYRIGIDKNNFRVNDDGEPSNSAGKPILQAIDSFGLTNVLVAVVRYFGGTKLGIPGLIKAYKTSTKEVLQEASIMEKELFERMEFELPQEKYNDVMQWLKTQKMSIIKQEFVDHHYQFILDVPASKLQQFKEMIGSGLI